MGDQAMKCGQAETLLQQRLDGELSSARSLELDRHLQSCTQCSRELRQLRGLERLLASMEVPPAEQARQAAKERVAQLLSRRPVVPLPRRSPNTWPARWRWAAAVLLFSALAGATAWFTLRDQAAPFAGVSFSDRQAVWESLQGDVLAAAAVPPGPEMARTHEALTNRLVSAMAFEQDDATALREAAVAYLRAFHRAVLPEIRDGLIAAERVRAFDAQRGELRRLSASGDATVAAAEAISAYAASLLRGRDSGLPLVAEPPAGTSLLAALSDTAVAMRDSPAPAQRLELLDALAARLARELGEKPKPPAVTASLRNMALRLSTEGILVQARRAAKDAAVRSRVERVLLDDAGRLAALLRSVSQLPPAQQGALRAAIGKTQAANAALIEELRKGTPAPPASRNLNEEKKGAVPPVSAEQRTLQDAAQPVPQASAPTAAPLVPPVDPQPRPQASPPISSTTGSQAARPGVATQNAKEPTVSPAGERPPTAPAGEQNRPVPGNTTMQTSKMEDAERRPVAPPNPTEHAPQADRPERPKRAEMNEHGAQVERPERPERPDRPERPELPEKPERPDIHDKPAGPTGGGSGNPNSGGTGGGNGNSGGGSGNTGGGSGNTGGGSGSGNGSGSGAGNGNGSVPSGGAGSAGRDVSERHGRLAKPERPTRR